MKMFAVLKESFIDEEHESVILDNQCFTNEIDAYDKMLEDAQYKVDDWNQSPPGEFKLELFPKVHSCSISGEFESDYVDYYVVPMDVVK